ncbi:hypothetical protein ACFU7Z_38720, partial [Kitasatospora sp. NPDC057518]|uniref:hypothetical protein n=1 Tax=Kitasatospora sp. NPDC057518 TaxID=3346155 RepID=UPI00367EEA7E
PGWLCWPGRSGAACLLVVLVVVAGAGFVAVVLQLAVLAVLAVPAGPGVLAARAASAGFTAVVVPVASADCFYWRRCCQWTGFVGSGRAGLRVLAAGALLI